MQEAKQIGKIVILNGTPRSGKSSIAEAIQNRFDGVWMYLGVDRFIEWLAWFICGRTVPPGCRYGTAIGYLAGRLYCGGRGTEAGPFVAGACPPARHL
ncbi:phosphotransferase-like protein [Paenibacillus cremeus]|uniref:phosphotransferase-like protein n=1 Tax=Paenibacillus cremeus TaxID=2163881 RepID=UPI003703D00D